METIMRLNAPIIKSNKTEKLQKYFDKVPHQNLNDFNTIKWFRTRVDDDVIKRSINTLLPDNGAPSETPYSNLTPEEKYKYKLKRFIENFQKQKSKYKDINILPKYLYSELLLTKINKLKEIFLEFDGDLSRKLEIDEVVEMFKKNNIPVQKEELIHLFFKDKNNKKLPKVPYLDFYQFMEFALSKESDQEFRNFMRKYKKMKEENLVEKEETAGEMFLPMNFNLILDYFNTKKDEREGHEKIKRAMDLMDFIMDPDHGGETNKNFNKNFLDSSRKFQIHEDINMEEIMSEFEKLLQNKPSSTHAFYVNRTNKKLQDIEIGGAGESINNRNADIKSLPNLLSNNKIKSSIKNQTKNNQGSVSGTLQITNYLLQKIENQELKNLTNKNYKKFKSIPLALEETKKIISKDYFGNEINLKSRPSPRDFEKIKIRNTRHPIKTKKNYQNLDGINITGHDKSLKTESINHHHFGKTHKNTFNNTLRYHTKENKYNYEIKYDSIKTNISNSNKLNVYSEKVNSNSKIKNDFIPLCYLRNLINKT